MTMKIDFSFSLQYGTFTVNFTAAVAATVLIGIV
jgi:hypothetical protein